MSLIAIVFNASTYASASTESRICWGISEAIVVLEKISFLIFQFDSLTDQTCQSQHAETSANALYLQAFCPFSPNQNQAIGFARRI